MGWFPFLQRKATQRTSLSEMESAINHALTADMANDAQRKVHITEEGALNLSAVWACVRILSETVGILPIHLFEQHHQDRSVCSATLPPDCFMPPTAFPIAST